MLGRYLAERLAPLAAVAAIHHRSADVVLWCALLWGAYLGVYELFYAWNDRRGVPRERHAPGMSILSVGDALWRAALMAIVVAWWLRAAPEPVDLRPFLVVIVLVMSVFALHNLLGEQGRLHLRTATFGLLAALRFLAVAALLLPWPVLQVLWTAHLLADALPRTVDYRLRKGRQMPVQDRLRLYRRLKMASAVVGCLAAYAVASTMPDTQGGRLPWLLLVFVGAYPLWRSMAALGDRLSARARR